MSELQQGQMPPGMVRPTPEQIAAMQRQIAADAERAGMTVPEFIEHIKKQQMEMMRQQQQQQQQQQQGHEGHDNDDDEDHGHQQQQEGQGQPITPGPPNPLAIALANFLKSQDLKPRTCILNGERKDMFRGNICPTLEPATCLLYSESMITNSAPPSQTCTPRHPIPRIRKSPQEESRPPRGHRPRLA